MASALKLIIQALSNPLSSALVRWLDYRRLACGLPAPRSALPQDISQRRQTSGMNFACVQVRQKRRRNLGISCVGFGGCFLCQITRASFHLLFATSRNRRAESNAPLSGRACPLHATVFHNCKVVCGIAGIGRVNPDSDCFSLLIFCDENRAEVLETANIIQRLTIKQDGVALLTRDEH